MSSSLPLVSVVVPIYGVERFLDKCVKSIVNQTYTNLQILLVDDGSRDRCGEMCDQWAQKDNRIIALHKVNGGLSDARNYGIDRAKGEYIYCVDSDDWIDEKLVERCVQKSQQTKADIVLFEYYKANEDGTIIELSHDAQKFPTEATYTGDDVLRFLWDDKIQNFAWAIFARRSIYGSGIRYPKNCLMEDMGTAYRIFAESKIAYLLKEPLYYYRIRSNSILSKKGSRFCVDAVKHIRNVDNFACSNKRSLLNNELNWSIRYLSSSLIWAYESRNDFSAREYASFQVEVKSLIKQHISALGFGHMTISVRVKVLGIFLGLMPAVAFVSELRNSRRL